MQNTFFTNHPRNCSSYTQQNIPRTGQNAYFEPHRQLCPSNQHCRFPDQKRIITTCFSFPRSQRAFFKAAESNESVAQPRGPFPFLKIASRRAPAMRRRGNEGVERGAGSEGRARAKGPARSVDIAASERERSPAETRKKRGAPRASERASEQARAEKVIARPTPRGSPAACLPACLPAPFTRLESLFYFFSLRRYFISALDAK